MTKIIVAFSKPGDAKNIKNILMRSGFQVVAVCTSGGQVLTCMEDLNGGIIVSGYRFEDMLYRDILEYMPKEFEMLLVASPNRFGGMMPQGIVCLPMPIKVQVLVDTLEEMCESQTSRKKKRKKQPVQRSEEETKLILEAKELLMERNRMAELEAHRYLQKCSMDSGTNMVETAQMVISLIRGQNNAGGTREEK
ncbi:MAG: ANTAR domain-containing protein [Hungatella sp.]|nr:ANTAR domain-containing protein [Hungatella sp.]